MSYLLNFNNWKNVYESQLLMEDDTVPTFEATFPDYKAVSAAFKTAYSKNSPSATYAGTWHYYSTIKFNPDTTGYNTYDVKITGLGLRRYKQGYFPDVAPSDEGVLAYWDEVKGLQSPTNWPDFVNATTKSFMLMPLLEKNAIDDVANINTRFNSIPLDKLKIMLTKYPNISNMMAKIKANNPDFMTKLTGNAKALYDSAVATTPAPAPVKKP
jgi:hypothetical protein